MDREIKRLDAAIHHVNLCTSRMVLGDDIFRKVAIYLGLASIPRSITS